MAANEYFARPQHAPYHDNSYSNSPLPPLPQSSHSPYSDNSYPYSHQQYGSSSTTKLASNDPYDDENSIPLSGQRAKHASATTLSPILPHEQDDPFVRDADPRKGKRRKGKDGWFRGKITWVVYVLSIIQLAVFIAEVAKNGKAKAHDRG